MPQFTRFRRGRDTGSRFAPRLASSTSSGTSDGRSGIQTLAEIVAGATTVAVLDVGGAIPITFGVVDLAGTVTASQLRMVTAGAVTQSDVVGLVIPFRGSLAAISLRSNTNKTTGTAVFTPYVDGVVSSLALTWVDGTSKAYKAIPQSSAIFNAGAEVDIRVTTVGFAPTTADIQVTVFVVLNPQTAL